MRIRKVRIKNYRSIIDSAEFEIEFGKTILVGPNEAGKTAILQAIQHLNPPEGVKPLNALRDFPRAHYNEITHGEKSPEDITVVSAEFELEDEDKECLPEGYKDAVYVLERQLDGSTSHYLKNVPERKSFSVLESDFLRLAAHADRSFRSDWEETRPYPSEKFKSITDAWAPHFRMVGDRAQALQEWMNEILPLIDEDNKREQNRFNRLKFDLRVADIRNAAVKELRKRVPIFVLFSNYFRVRPVIHLGQLATRIANGSLDDERYDYGNVCLLNLLGFEAAELSKMGQAMDPDDSDPDAIDEYREQLDERQYQLNAAEVRLTNEIQSVWMPDEKRGETAKVRLRADGQYLKVTVEDDLGVEVELDQRSEGFQWIVSFFVVFFSEAKGKHKNAVLLLDEPGLSLHALKQRDFRETISRLAKENQTIYTTHSPFLVGPNELDQVRVVEMCDRKVGTKVNTSLISSDPAALLPLQEALGYDLAQSLFTQKKNFILEGLTDYWYVESVTALLRDAGECNLNERIALVPAGTAGKVAYFATILHAQGLKVAALLDSDNAGNQAANQDTLIHTLGNKCILRTKEFMKSPINGCEIEDLLRETLITVAINDLGWDVSDTAKSNPAKPIVKVFKRIRGFSKYRLAKAFLKWARNHSAADLTQGERDQWKTLVESANKALK